MDKSRSSPQYFRAGKTLVPWVLVSVVLGLSLLCIDFLVSGPVSTWFLHVTVIGPVEERYGFSAEWRAVGRTTQLVVTSVNPQGTFAKAGVRPGSAFPFIGCGNFYYDGAWYRVLAANPATIRLESVPGKPSSVTVYRLSVPRT